jgi:hypothetical protein
VVGFLLGIVGKRVLGKEFAKTVKAIEARNARASTEQGAAPMDAPEHQS